MMENIFLYHEKHFKFNQIQPVVLTIKWSSNNFSLSLHLKKWNGIGVSLWREFEWTFMEKSEQQVAKHWCMSDSDSLPIVH